MSDFKPGLSENYAKTVEDFLRLHGVTEDTANEYEFCTPIHDIENTEVRHQGKPWAIITTTLEKTENGTSWQVKCRKL